MDKSREAIYYYLVDQILGGKIALNDSLPTEEHLAKMFHASRMSARFAIRILEQKGVVWRKKSRGTRLSRVPSPALARDLTSALCRVAYVLVAPGGDPLHWNHLTLQEMERTLRADGYEMALEQVPENADRAQLERILNGISSRGAAALVLMPTLSEGELYLDNLDLFFQYHRNIFVFDYGGTPPEQWPFHVLSLHPFGEGAQAAECLFDRGFRRTVFLRPEGMSRVYWIEQRELGLRYGLLRASNGLLKAETWGLPTDGAELRRRLADSREHTAVVAANDHFAAGLLDQAHTAGLDAPRDFGLISFGDDPKFRSYNLTTLAPPLARIGQMIAQLVSGKRYPRECGNRICISVGSELIERGTCRAPQRGVPELMPVG